MSFFRRKGAASQAAPDVSRNKLRGLIRKASRGNIFAFTQLSNNYLDVLSEYFYLLGHTCSKDRIFEIQKLLTECWRYLPYTRRVSDFEHFLQLQLEKRSRTEDCNFPDPHSNLNEISHIWRFLLVAREFEQWDYRSLKLCLRINKHDLADQLMRLKCKLTGFKPSMLKTHDQLQIIRVSELLEGELPEKASRKLESEIATAYHALQFKADWLSYRCELIELRQHMRLDADERKQLNDRLSELLKNQPMERPKMSDNIINQFSFIRIKGRMIR